MKISNRVVNGLIAGVAAWSGFAGKAHAAELPPNIVFILVDDMGWRDLQCFGSTFYETPNIDRLASEGMVFTNAYAAAPVCSPTRAILLTGQYPARIGLTNFLPMGPGAHPVKGRVIDAPYTPQLPLEKVNLARVLSAGGYQTWHVGKWHLGDAAYFPDKQGFDVNIAGAHLGQPGTGFFSPWGIPTLPDGKPGDYLTDEAVHLIRERDPKRPYFLNFWHYAVHTPIQAPPELVAKYEEKARKLGLDKIDSLESGEPMPVSNKKQPRVVRRTIQAHATYAAMVENLDTNIGRLLAAIDGNTLVVFTSDNGGLLTAAGSPTTNAPLLNGKGWLYEGGTRVPLIARWPGRVKPGTRSDVVVTSPDFYPTFLAAAGVTVPSEQPVDGVNLLPVLEGKTDFVRGPVFWHYPHYGNQGGTPGSAVRDGDWKLIEFFEDGRLELYNLPDDIGENTDLS